MQSIRIEETRLSSRDQALGLEWIDTNGKGGYASSSLLHCHTRKYHGLMVANLKNPAGRFVLLSKFEDSLVVKKQEFFLSCHQYPQLFFPPREHFLTEFALDLYPCFTYRLGDLLVHKSIMLVDGEDHLLIRYDFENGPSSGVLRLKPFLAYRDYHKLSRENLFLRVKTFPVENGFKIDPYAGMPPLFIRTSLLSRFYPSPVWYNNFEYRGERERGYDFNEDLFQPGILEVQIRKGSCLIVSCATKETAESPRKLWDKEEKRRVRNRAEEEKCLDRIRDEESKKRMAALVAAGGKFLVKTPAGRPALIAGYHWFGDWGRDTLISLPALTFQTGRMKEGIEILLSLGHAERKGLLPNFFAEKGRDNAYNSLDAPLWYFWAVQELLAYGGDADFVRDEIWPIMKRIIKNLYKGTIYGIGMAEDGLLHGGNDRTQLTWMDACVAGKPVTPRAGCAVEINALWYNALCFASDLGKRFDDGELQLEGTIQKLRRSFRDAFWIEEGSYLGDVYQDGVLDKSIRPNQILAVSLPFSPLEPVLWEPVVEKVRQHLLTPFGLRTLSPEDERYQGRYSGDQNSRDGAYHQGTVWPWLIYHFALAYLKTEIDRERAKTFLRDHLNDFVDAHLSDAGIGCISEIFDGDPPYRPHGCISQAWSVAALIATYNLLVDDGGGNP
ncbi:MAG: amylo-alpha-1,6-glucosidase [Smithellaceae bacterium]|nr:amylo-alpha-1,6-glucosidase [Smithellaceae bacterium]